MTWMADTPARRTIRYRFRVRHPGEDHQMIRDYGPIGWLNWATEREGLYEIGVSARNLDTGETSTTSEIFPVASRVAADETAVNPTDHPLVFLFSASACPGGARMRVKYQSAAGGPMQQTPYQDCALTDRLNRRLLPLSASDGPQFHLGGFNNASCE